MKRKCVIVSVCFLWVLAGATQSTSAYTRLTLDTMMERLAGDFLNHSGRMSVSIGLISEGQTYTSCFGKVDTRSNSSPTAHTLYEIGSITKTFTGLLLAQAVVDGKIKLEDDVRYYLKDSFPNLQFKGSPIRIVHLLNHSSRLPFMLPDSSYLLKNITEDTPFKLAVIEGGYTREMFFKDLHAVKIDTVPGLLLSYSNVGAQLLGYIMEDRYGMSYEALVKKYITRPLAMKETALSLTKAQRGRLAKGYSEKGVEMPRNISGPAGGLLSSASDLLKYMKLQMQEEDPRIALSHKPTWGSIRYYAIGLNWQMDHRQGSDRRIFQSGGTAGYNSYMLLLPEKKVGVVLLTNGSDPNAQHDLSLAAQELIDFLNK